MHQRITELEQAEVTSHQEKQKCWAIVAMAHDLVYEWDVATGKLEWFGHPEHTLGYALTEMPQTLDELLTWIHPDDRPQMFETLELRKRETVIRGLEYRVRRRDGGWSWWLERATPLAEGDGIPHTWLCACLDITERREAEMQLREYQRRLEQQNAELHWFSQAVAQSANAVIITDLEGVILYVNPRFEEITGYTAEEALGQTPRILKSGEHDEAFYRELWETITSGREWHGIFHNRRKDGTLYWEQAAIAPVYDEQGRMTNFIAIKEDITEYRRMREQLFQAEKLAALGRVAASLAHEINNPLQALRSGLRLLTKANLDEHKRRQYLIVALREVERLIALTERVLGYYRPSDDTPVPTDIHAVLDEILMLVQKELEHSQVNIRREYAGELPHVHGIVGRLKQVFLNIILNAVQAMPTGGTLTIATEYIPDDVTVRIRFTDTGHGIHPDQLKRLFEPFYTTKPHGSGLGLSVSYQIIRQHGGRIEVESEPGRGATFTVILPVHQGDRQAGGCE